MAEDKTYNGWTNWETWLVHLWFGDALHDYVEEDRIDDPDSLKTYVQEYVEADAEFKGFLSDVLNGFWSEVNWREILASCKE